MPRTADPDRYPVEFFDLIDRATNGEVILIPPPEGGGPAGLRAYIQAFFKACETREELRDKAKQLSVTIDKPTGHVRVSHRSQGVYAGLVRTALGGPPIDEAARAAEQALLSTLPL